MLKKDDFPFLSVQNYESTLKKIESAWENFIKGEVIPDFNLPRKPVFESWKRSKQMKVPFDLKKAPLRLNKSELAAEKESKYDLYRIIDSFLDNIYKVFHDENMAVSFSNERGIIMSIRAGKAMQEKYCLISAIPGSSLSESDCGTNSIGTSLYTWKPIQIYATEHYCKTAHTLNSSSALIREPSSGIVLGVLTLTTHKDIVPAHTLNWTISEAEKIQNAIQYFQKENSFANIINNYKATGDCGEFKCIIGKNPSFNNVINLAYKFSDSDMPVLITGDTGTGKEVLARAIHNRSSRKDKTFLPVNCGAIPKELISSELYGYVEGAFTGTQKGGRIGKIEASSGGTLFLDEICEMPVDMQIYLLRALEEGTITRVGSNKAIPVNLRIICATNKDIREEVKKGNFRKDLYYRLNGVELHLPTLRERGDDIILLAEHFMKLKSNELKLSEDAVKVLMEYSWPGNVRELKSVINRAVLISSNFIITSNEIHITDNKQELEKSKQEINEKQLTSEKIKQVINECKGNKTLAANHLDISRMTLYRKIKELNL
ncbi:MAG: sigma-54-dependent Fis family transcriptional regulator [Sedimentibacter sp.]|nr:sigma-54-dependent Fis family transcriptional regulator [Sedimentibacter sp.]